MSIPVGRHHRQGLPRQASPAHQGEWVGAAIAASVLVAGEVVLAAAAWLAADVAATDHSVRAGVLLMAVLAAALAWPAVWAWWHRRTVSVTVLPPPAHTSAGDR